MLNALHWLYTTTTLQEDNNPTRVHFTVDKYFYASISILKTTASRSHAGLTLQRLRMQFFLLLLVMVAVAPPVDMKTVEELEQEMKIKFDKNEQRLSYLEEMAKLNVIRSCDELSQFGVRVNNFYRIDPDGPLTGSDPVKVWCEFTQDGRSITEVLHNSEQSIEVEKCPEPGCYHHPVTYSIPDNQIKALIEISEACEQQVRYDCLLAPLNDAGINFGYWSDKDNQPQVYWHGSHQGEHVCSCFYEPGGCFSPYHKNAKCNCDANVPELKSDAGTITDMSALPITSLHFGGFKYAMQKASHTLGRLRCWGKAAYEEGTSCDAIKRSGQFHSGFYNVRENEAGNTDLVFCNMASPGYGENEDRQTFIESSETHFEQVEQDLIKVNEDVSKTNADVSKVEQDLVKVNEDIVNIQHDVAMHSSFCGYQSSWTADNTIITYKKLLVEDNNIPGASLDASSGRYTAGTAGTYEMDLSIGYMYSNNALSNYMYIRLNEATIDESRIYSELRSSHSNAKENGGRSMMIQLKKGDTLSVYGQNINSIGYITFCVKLITAST